MPEYVVCWGLAGLTALVATVPEEETSQVFLLVLVYR